MKPSSYFLILILLTMALMIGISLTFRYFESALLPVLVGSLVFVLAAVELWREVSAKDQSPKGKGEGEGVGAGFGSMLSWLFGFGAAIYLAGFLIALPLFFFLYLKWRKRSWGTAIAFAAITTLLIYLVFEMGFRTELWKGLIFG
jgi:hypothetical protein